MNRFFFITMGTVLVLAANLCFLMIAFAGSEKKIPLSQVPAPVIAAAEKAVEGITLTGALLEKEHGETVYEIKGYTSGKKYEIEVTEKGKVLEIEKDDGDD